MINFVWLIEFEISKDTTEAMFVSWGFGPEFFIIDMNVYFWYAYTSDDHLVICLTLLPIFEFTPTLQIPLSPKMLFLSLYFLLILSLNSSFSYQISSSLIFSFLSIRKFLPHILFFPYQQTIYPHHRHIFIQHDFYYISYFISLPWLIGNLPSSSSSSPSPAWFSFSTKTEKTTPSKSMPPLSSSTPIGPDPSQNFTTETNSIKLSKSPLSKTSTCPLPIPTSKPTSSTNYSETHFPPPLKMSKSTSVASLWEIKISRTSFPWSLTESKDWNFISTQFHLEKDLVSLWHINSTNSPF